MKLRGRIINASQAIPVTPHTYGDHELPCWGWIACALIDRIHGLDSWFNSTLEPLDHGFQDNSLESCVHELLAHDVSLRQWLPGFEGVFCAVDSSIVQPDGVQPEQGYGFVLKDNWTRTVLTAPCGFCGVAEEFRGLANETLGNVELAIFDVYLDDVAAITAVMSGWQV